MPGLQGKGLDSSIGVVGTLPQANLVERGGVCEGGVVVVCAGHIACGMSSPETGSIASHRFSTTKEAEPPTLFAYTQQKYPPSYPRSNLGTRG